MDLIPLAVGVLLLASVFLDLFWTTLWVEGGAGPLTSRVMAGTWRILRPFGGTNSRFLTLSGPIILVVSLTMWIVLLWGGWTLVFASSEGSLVDTIDQTPITWPDLIYFTGYTIFTLGNGDYAPRGGVWQILTALTTGSGMLFVTLSVTYVLNVLSAVTQKRSFASGISGLGDYPAEILLASWNGEEFTGLEIPLNTFTSQLNTLTSNHKAYPIIHHFHSKQPSESPVVSVAILDETLSVLQFGLSKRSNPSNPAVKNARSSVESYLDTLKGSFVEAADRSPPPPNLDSLREDELPIVSDEALAAALEDVEKRRRTLHGLVESDEREWPSQPDE